MAGRYTDHGWRDPTETERWLGYGVRPRTSEDRRPDNLLHHYALKERSQRLKWIHQYSQVDTALRRHIASCPAPHAMIACPVLPCAATLSLATTTTPS